MTGSTNKSIDTADRIALGFGNLSASAGDHVVHFYYTPRERLGIQAPFLLEGLRTNQRCVVLGPEPDREELEAALSSEGVDVEAVVGSGQLVIGPGGSDVQQLEEMLQDAIEPVPSRFDFLRWCGDMTWTFDRLANSEVLMEWESACNVVGPSPVVFMCHYDLTLFNGDVVIDALRTHPLAIIGSAIHQSPYYQSPESFLEDMRNRRGADPVARV